MVGLGLFIIQYYISIEPYMKSGIIRYFAIDLNHNSQIRFVSKKCEQYC